MEAAIKNILLIHWDVPEAKARVKRLESFGYSAAYLSKPGPALMRAVLGDLPNAFVIDLSRLPLQGRDVAVDLRAHPATRRAPIVFVDGLPEKVMLVRETLPDAVYSTWTHLEEDLAAALHRPWRPVVVPEAPAATAKPASSRQSLAGKLGIAPNTVAAVLGAPPDFMSSLEPLPSGAVVRRQMGDDVNLVIWLIRSRRELDQSIAVRADRLGRARLWILWPKQGTGQTGDLIPEDVREAAQEHGLTGEKPVSVDPKWFGMAFDRETAA